MLLAPTRQSHLEATKAFVSKRESKTQPGVLTPGTAPSSEATLKERKIQKGISPTHSVIERNTVFG
jgi:hypothetical protein